jgi:hypothetical protein
MGREILAPADQVRLAIPLPDGAREQVTSPIDLSTVAGAQLALQRAYSLPNEGSLEVACVRAAADLWVPGLEQAVLAGASAMVRDWAGLSTLEPGAITSVDGHWQQPFEGSVAQPQSRSASGRHVLGFLGPDGDAMICSLVCAAPPPAEQCRELSAGLQVQGALSLPPAPGMIGTTLSFAAAHPPAALSVAAVLVLVVAALIVIRRPRPAW